MNTNKIISALRNSCSGCEPTPCCEFEVLGPAAADLIEALTAQGDATPSIIPCCICGGEVVEFTVPNDIWNHVIRHGGPETDREYLCLDCWYKALRNELGLPLAMVNEKGESNKCYT